MPLHGVWVKGVGMDVMNRDQISNYRTVNGAGSIMFDEQLPKGEDVQDFWVYDPTTKDWDIQTMEQRIKLFLLLILSLETLIL